MILKDFTISNAELKKSELFLKKRETKNKIFFKKEKNFLAFTSHDFYEYFEVKYMPFLYFERVKDLKSVIYLCKKAKKKEKIGEKEIWFGTYYENEIVNGYIPNVFIKWIDYHKGYGLFALSNLKKDSFIGVYTGHVRKHKKRLDRKNGYCFEYQTLFSKKTPFTIDAKYGGNYTRFINHSFNPNLSLFLAYCKNIMHIILVTNRDIEKEEELTYDYGENYWKKREKPRD
jgi:hypothetical protein